jgi:CRISPR-associated protein Cst1
VSLIEWTGNPFVDAGITAIIVYRSKKQPQEIVEGDLTEAGNFIRQVYETDGWTSTLYSVFVNHPLNQSSCNLWEVFNKQTGEVVPPLLMIQKAKKYVLENVDFDYRLAAKETGNKKRESFDAFINVLLKHIELLGESGNCIACGKRNVRVRKNRQHVPMTGSGGVVNFFSFTADGADYCDTCTFAIQCSPLTYYACGKLALLHSNSVKVMRRWATRAIANVQEQIASGSFTGCFNEGYTNPQNALFHLAQDLIVRGSDDWQDENPSLRLYHFTNYIQGPELDIYDLPTPVFKFLAEVRRHTRFRDWQRIINRGFYFVKKGKWINLSVEGKSEGNYKNSKNKVYQDLLAGRSILHRFINAKLHKGYGDFSLLEVYLTEVLAMNKTRIETVKKVADEIDIFIRQSPKGERRLRNLEASVKFRDFCNVLRRISSERIALKAEEPLFTLDEFAEHLFPDGALTFGETRYLILFRLYEQLHDWLLEQGITPDEDDDKIVEIGDDKPLAPNDNAQLVEGAMQ